MGAQWDVSSSGVTVFCLVSRRVPGVLCVRVADEGRGGETGLVAVLAQSRRGEAEAVGSSSRLKAEPVALTHSLEVVTECRLVASP